MTEAQIKSEAQKAAQTTLEEAAKARERVIAQANKGTGWIAQHPRTTFWGIVALVVAILAIAIKAWKP